MNKTKNKKIIKVLKHLLRFVIFFFLGLYIAIIGAFHIPYLQREISRVVATELSNYLDTQVKIEGMDIGVLNRIVVRGLSVKDQKDNQLLQSNLVTGKIEIIPLITQGKIRVSNIQLFNFHVNLYKETPKSKTNFQFIIDKFASKKPKKKSKLDLRFNSILIRGGNVDFNLLYKAPTPGKFNPSHLNIKNLSANISVKALTNDSLNVYVRQLAFREGCGFSLLKLSGKFLADRKNCLIQRLRIKLPGSNIRIDKAHAYYKFTDAREFLKTLRLNGELQESFVTPADIAAFVPALHKFDDPVYLHFSFRGSPHHLRFPSLILHTENKDVHINLSARLDLKPSVSVSSTIHHASLTSTGIRFLWNELSSKANNLPPVLTRLGNIDYRGTFSFKDGHISTNGQLNTGLGNLAAQFKMNKTKAFVANVQTAGFQLGTLLSNSKLGHISTHIQTSGQLINKKLTDLTVNGTVSDFDFNNYRYGDIRLNGNYHHGTFTGICHLQDTNGDLFVNGQFNTSKPSPEFNLKARLKGFDPHALHLTPKYKNTKISLNLMANFRGNSLNNMNGIISLEDLKMTAPDKEFIINNITVDAHNEGKNRVLHLNSDFMTAMVKGDFKYATLPASVAGILAKNLPSLVKLPSPKEAPDNNFEFRLTLHDASPLKELFNVPLQLNEPVRINGYFNDHLRKMHVEGFFPSFQYGNGKYESGRIVCENPEGKFHISANVAKYFKGNSLVSFAADATAHDNKLDTSISWGNDKAVTYSGELNSTFNFIRHANKKLMTTVELHPSEVIIEDSIWKVHPSTVEIQGKHIEVKNFLFEHDTQHIGINGILSQNASDSLTVDMKDVNLSYIFDIVNFHTVDFSGLATGKAYVKNVFSKTPDAYTNLHVSNFKFNHAYMGEMDLFSKWDRELQGIYMDAHIKEGNISTTSVTGYVSPPRKYLDIRVTANNSNAAFIQEYCDGIFSDVEGRVRGQVRVYGQLRKVNMEGNALADMKMKVDVLNTVYEMKNQRVELRPNIVEFANDTIRDVKGSIGIVNGALHHNFLHDLTYDFNITAQNLLCYDKKEVDELPFYGTIYGSGRTEIRGKAGQVNINLNFTPDDHTEFVYIAGKTNDITETQFITFVDKTPKREQPWLEEDSTETDSVEKSTGPDIHMNFMMNINPKATVKVIIDPLSGDCITATGSGTLEASFYNRGKFQMYGTYTIDKGNYKFTLQQVIHKEFNVAKGGVVHFTGDPFNAEMNLQCIYTVTSASLNDLIPGMSFKQNNVKVNCLMNLSGPIQKPDIKFNLDLPTVSEEENELVHSAISTEEQMNMQILYLLGVGRFYTYDYVSSTTNPSQTAVNSLISSTLSGQLNQFLSRSLNLRNWNIGANLATGDRGWSDMDFEGILSGSLLNNRLLINGNFGYKENSLTNMGNTNFVGDFDVQWLLNRSGNVSLKAYNKTNDRYFSKSTLYTQGIGIQVQREFDSWKRLFRFLHPKKKTSTNISKDTVKEKSRERTIFIKSRSEEKREGK